MNPINEKREVLKAIGENFGDEYIKHINSLEDEEINNIFKNELNDVDIDTLTNALESERSELSKKILELPSNSSILKTIPKEYLDSIEESKEQYEGKVVKANVTVDPVTGDKNIDTNTKFDNNLSELSLSEIINNNTEKYNFSTIVKENIGDDLTENDMIEILSFFNKVEKEKPKKLYPLLPNIIKKSIRNTIPEFNPEYYEIAANEFYSMIKRELIMEKEFIELENAIENEMDIPDITDMYLDHIRDIMEKDILIRADNIEKTDIDKANILRNMSKSFTDGYTYETLLKKIKNKKSIINKELTKELNRYDKYCSKFNAKYKRSKFVITDIRSLLYILDRKLPDDISIDSIKKFIILFCKICRNYSPDDLIQHTYMYYTTKLIESLDHIDSPKTDMSKTIIKNITTVIKKIEN